MDYPSRKTTKKFCSQKCAAKSKIEILRKRSLGNNWGTLRKITDELRKKLSNAQLGKHYENRSIVKRGEKNPNWRGGTTPENKRIRNSSRFAQWRTSVFERDNYTCQFCQKRGGELHPDHIKPFALFPEIRFELSNGRTLCKPCHMKTDTWGLRNYKLPTEQK